MFQFLIETNSKKRKQTDAVRTFELEHASNKFLHEI